MRSRALSFPGADGHQLAALLDLPVDNEPVACALFAHCFTCSKDFRALEHIARALTQEGIAVLRFDFTGLGDSEGDFRDSHFAANVDDIVAAADFLAQQLEAPTLLVGHSLGGSSVLQAATRLKEVRAVATIAAPADPEHVAHLFEDDLEDIRDRGEAQVRISGRAFTVTRDFLDRLEETEMQGTMGGLEAALLVLHAPGDDIVGVENARRLFDWARHPKSFVSLDEADHFLSDDADARYVGTVVAAWATRYLGVRRKDLQPAEPHDSRITARTDAGELVTDIMANGHAFHADEPTSVGGTNRGPTPYDLVVAGLGACTTMTLQMYAQREGWPLESATVRLRHQKVHADDCTNREDEGAKIDHIDREIVLRGSLDADQRQRLLQVAERCPVHRTLTGTVRVETSLLPPDPS